ncbi:DUF4290 domain-containing protein [Paradesertivirga mongoliensis]|uniref:DUF4290 domain-containing protein n=1 Tax=Paradesertivirga mongoliensis TaxID=2100740 RepID=A0ABW4ZQJ5_9SPHI|nr:DUF4290 domain-containing protein [Pedobacter mongoliensis]
MTFDYNTSRKKLILAEYGRNVQNMVAYICTLPTKEERNRHAQVVIDLMGFLNPHLRDVADFKHKLWDHLHIISDFQIDVDSNYPKPAPDAIHFKPAPLAYPQQRIRFKHYGKTVELMIKKAKAVEDPQRRQAMIQSIANFMKMAYVTWNKDTVADETIISDLKALSGGELVLDESFNLHKIEVRPNAPGVRQKSGSNSGNNGNSNSNKPRQNTNNASRNQGNRPKNTGKRY